MFRVCDLGDVYFFFSAGIFNKSNKSEDAGTRRIAIVCKVNWKASATLVRRYLHDESFSYLMGMEDR